MVFHRGLALCGVFLWGILIICILIRFESALCRRIQCHCAVLNCTDGQIYRACISICICHLKPQALTFPKFILWCFCKRRNRCALVFVHGHFADWITWAEYMIGCCLLLLGCRIRKLIIYALAYPKASCCCFAQCEWCVYDLFDRQFVFFSCSAYCKAYLVPLL